MTGSLGVQDLFAGRDTDEAAGVAHEVAYAIELFIASHTKQTK